MKKFYLTFAVILSFGLLFAACSKKEKKEKKDIVDVLTIESVKADVKWDILYPAKVTGTKVKAKVSGTLTEILYKEGEPIEKGAHMFVIDKQSYKAAYDRASVVLENTKLQYEKSKKKLAEAKNAYIKKPAKKKEYDAASVEYKKADLEYNNAKTAMDDAEMQLKNTRITAPVSGIAGAAMHKVGASISPLEGSDVLTYIAAANPLKVSFYMPVAEVENFRENFLQGKIKTDAKITGRSVPLEAHLSDGSVYPERGSIAFINVKTEVKKGYASVEAEFPNPEKKKTVIAGQDINVKILNAYYAGAVAVLKTCLFKSESGTFVFVVQPDSSAAIIPVTYAVDGDYAFITSGLQGGEIVVSHASGSIEAGKKVNAKKIDFSVPERYNAVKTVVPVEETPKADKPAVQEKKAAKKPASSVKPNTKTKQSASKKAPPKSKTASASKKKIVKK